MAGVSTKKPKIVITGTDDDVMSPFKKLLSGFCDPTKHELDDDSLEIHSRELPDDKTPLTPLQAYAEGQTHGFSSGVEEDESKVSPPNTIAEDDAPIEPESIEVVAEAFETKVITNTEPPVLKSSISGSKARFMRGFGTAFFTLLAVIATVLILNHLGYELDLKVVETKVLSEHQKLVNFVFNEKANKDEEGANGVYSESVEAAKEDTVEKTIDPPVVEVDEVPPQISEADEAEDSVPPEANESNGDDVESDEL